MSPYGAIDGSKLARAGKLHTSGMRFAWPKNDTSADVSSLSGARTVDISDNVTSSVW
jgi:hypothetical protein